MTHDIGRYIHIATIIDKIFETNSSFNVKQRTTGKCQFLFVRSLLLVLKKMFLGVRLGITL